MAVEAGPLTTLVALNRFGLGARPGDFAAASGDPRGFLVQELKKPDIAALSANGLPSSAEALQQLFEQQEQRKRDREQKPPQSAPVAAAGDMPGGQPKPAETTPALQTPQQMAAAPQPDMGGGQMGGGPQVQPPSPGAAPAMTPDGKPQPKPSAARDLYREEAMARFQKQAQADAGFVERLVAFWSNHFAISAGKGEFVRAVAGSFEREAIRPHVLGRFADMLKAVEQHPAMLFYLDNQSSIGPNSKAGKNRGKGLNENLAREILELHTLGVDGGYSQADVTSLARIITGWTFVGREGRGGVPGTFSFFANAHEPGDHSLLGKGYEQAGIAQGETALGDLARHPATARHIATKLARHFIADDPPPPLVERLTKTFRDTDGDLAELSMALIQDDDAWRAPMTKMRSPSEFITAIVRATGVLPPEPQPILGALLALGMPTWTPPGPNGFPDTAAAWASPEAMKVRLDVAWRAAQRSKDTGQPIALLEQVAGAAASNETREAVGRAESRQQALAILFMSPEFQRR